MLARREPGWSLFLTWWNKVNWGIAAILRTGESPSARFSPEHFWRQAAQSAACSNLHPFDEFVDQVVQAAHMRCLTGDDSRERSIYCTD